MREVRIVNFHSADIWCAHRHGAARDLPQPRELSRDDLRTYRRHAGLQGAKLLKSDELDKHLSADGRPVQCDQMMMALCSVGKRGHHIVLHILMTRYETFERLDRPVVIFEYAARFTVVGTDEHPLIASYYAQIGKIRREMEGIHTHPLFTKGSVPGILNHIASYALSFGDHPEFASVVRQASLEMGSAVPNDAGPQFMTEGSLMVAAAKHHKRTIPKQFPMQQMPAVPVRAALEARKEEPASPRIVPMAAPADAPIDNTEDLPIIF